MLDRLKFDNEYELYKERKEAIKHSEILDLLSTQIKVNNPYFGKIHLNSGKC